MALAFRDMGSTRRSVGITPEFNRAYSRTYGTIRARINAGTFDPLADWKKMTFDLYDKQQSALKDAWATSDTLEYRRTRDKNMGRTGDRFNAELDANAAEIARLTNPNYLNIARSGAYDSAGYSAAERAMFEELSAQTGNQPGSMVLQ